MTNQKPHPYEYLRAATKASSEEMVTVSREVLIELLDQFEDTSIKVIELGMARINSLQND